MIFLLVLIAQWGPDYHETKFSQYRPYLPVQIFKDSTHSYDVRKYEVEISVPMTGRNLSGLNRIYCRSRQNGLTFATLHSATLTIDTVRVNGVSATYTAGGETLRVNLPQVYNNGDSFMIYIRYHGSWSVTSTQYGYCFYPRNYNSSTRHAVGYTMSECWDARRWIPCFDQPYDKAEQGCIIKVTAPDSFTVCANGDLMSVVTNPGNTKTFTWQENYPIATYLMHFGVSRFAVWSQWYFHTASDSIEIRHFIWPEDSTASRTAFSHIPNAMYLFDSLYGRYPFKRYGQDAVYPFAYGGMEHQEQTTIHRNWITNNSENGMAHELAHQWGGDMVTCVDFRDIWLNEGFATYSDANYNGYRFGADSFVGTMRNRANSYFSADASSRRPLYNPPSGDEFNWGYTYCKASWVYHMLRYLNQPQYFPTVHEYLDSFAYKTASTDDMNRIFSRRYGQDLSWFFNEWVYGQGHPQYNIYWNCAASGPNYRVRINMFQVQTNAPPVFHMPVQIRLNWTGGDTTVNIAVAAANEFREYLVSHNVTSITFDPGYWLLCRVNTYIGTDEIPGPQSITTLTVSPNPFRTNTGIRFTIQDAGSKKNNLSLKIYDASGRLVKDLSLVLASCGMDHVSWNGHAVPPGVYFLQAATATDRKVVKIIKTE